ncbi:MAG TPA: EamA family transporter, partial [Methylomirabilota bacterium]|nr:EamA family transporter [Methylomirabilota bacterium]
MWLLLGLVSGFSEASRNVLAKHNTKSFNSIVITWAWTVWSFIIIIPPMFLKGTPHLDSIFWTALIIKCILYCISLLLYVEAIKKADLSLTLPMLALTPVYLLFTGFLINHELPKATGMIGVLLIVAGAYLLNFERGKTKFIDPFFEIYKNKGVLMMFVVSIIWSVTSSLDKLAILHSNPFFYGGAQGILLGALLTPLAFLFSYKDLQKSFNSKYILQIIPLGLFDGLQTIAVMLGQSLSLTVFVISVKRTSIIFSALLGWYFFKEPIKNRLLPICLMVLGVF